MRFFLGKDAGSVVREKRVYTGDDAKADAEVTAFLALHPGWTTQEVNQATFDATVTIVDPTPSRNAAAAQLLTGISDQNKLDRAVLLVILDEINTIRALPSLAQSPRTAAQLKTAIQNKLTSGAAD